MIRVTGADAKGASVILAWPAGLVRMDDDGRARNRTVTIRIRQRPAAGGAWQVVQTLNVTAAKTEGFYRQHSWTFPQRGRWEIELTRMTDESTSSQVSERTNWLVLQTLRPEYPMNFSAAPLALVGLRVKATHQLAGSLDNISAVASRLCPDFDRASGRWISPRNSWGFKTSRSYVEPPHAFRVQFLDASNDFAAAERLVPWPGHTGEITLTEAIELPGKTDPAEIWREARRRQYEAMHRPDTYEVIQDGPLRVATRGDLVALSHDVLDDAQVAARVLRVDGSAVTLDEQLTIVEGRSYGLRFRLFGRGDTIGTSHADRERAKEGEALNEVGRQRETLSVHLDRLDGLLIGKVCSP